MSKIYYSVTGYDENNNAVKTIIHKYPYNDFVKNWLDDFYLRYICPLDYETDKRSDREILLKKPIQGIKRILADNMIISPT